MSGIVISRKRLGGADALQQWSGHPVTLSLRRQIDENIGDATRALREAARQCEDHRVRAALMRLTTLENIQEALAEAGKVQDEDE